MCVCEQKAFICVLRQIKPYCDSGSLDHIYTNYNPQLIGNIKQITNVLQHGRNCTLVETNTKNYVLSREIQIYDMYVESRWRQDIKDALDTTLPVRADTSFSCLTPIVHTRVLKSLVTFYRHEGASETQYLFRYSTSAFCIKNTWIISFPHRSKLHVP